MTCDRVINLFFSSLLFLLLFTFLFFLLNQENRIQYPLCLHSVHFTRLRSFFKKTSSIKSSECIYFIHFISPLFYFFAWCGVVALVWQTGKIFTLDRTKTIRHITITLMIKEQKKKDGPSLKKYVPPEAKKKCYIENESVQRAKVYPLYLTLRCVASLLPPPSIPIILRKKVSSKVSNDFPTHVKAIQ